MPIVDTLQKIGKFWRQGFTSRPTVKNIDMGVFSDTSHDVTMVDGENKNLSKITMGDRVVGYNPDTREKETYQVTGVEMIDPERFYYVLNDKYAFHGKQSVMIGKNAIHVFRLRKGQKLQLENGTLEEITSIKRVYTPCPFIKLSIDGHHTFFLNGVLVHNASRYWVGGTGSWNGTAGTKWSTTSGGGGGSAEPTASDDVFLDAASGAVTVTIVTTPATCLNLDFTGFTGTFAGSVALSVAGNLTIATGMTRTYTGAITFTSTATGKTVTFNGKTMASNLVFNGVGGGWTFQDNLNDGTASITLTNGSLNLNGKTVTAGSLSSSNSNTRTLTLGAATLTLGTSFNLSTTTGLTFSGASSTISIAGTSSGASFSSGSQTFGTVTLNSDNSGNDPGIDITGSPTMTTLNLANTTLGINQRARIGGNITVSGTFTATGFDDITKRLTIQSSSPGTARTITAATTSLANISFIDITGAGAGAWTGTRLGDAGGNSGITFDASVDRFWVGNTGNYSATAEWAATSGGAGGASVPLPQDRAFFDANSFSTTGFTVTVDVRCIAKVFDASAVTNSPTFTMSSSKFFCGDVILASGMTWTNNVSTTLGGRGAHIITSAGKTFSANGAVTFSSVGGSYTLQDNFTLGAGSTFTNFETGTFDANDFDVTLVSMSSAGALARTITMGNGTWFFSGTGTVWDTSTTTNLTVNAEGSTIDVNANTATARTVTAGSVTLNHLKISDGTSNVTLTNVNCNDLDFTGFDGTLLNGTTVITIRGDLTLVSTMTVQASTRAFTMAATSGTKDMTSGGITVDRPVTFNGVGGKWQLLDDWVIGTSRAVTLTNGHFDLNDFDIESGTFSSSNSNTRELSFGSGTFRVKSTGTVWSCATSTNFTINKETGTVKIDDASATGKTFAGGGKGYYRLLLSGAGTGTFTLSGSNTFDILEADTPPHTIIFTASTTTTILTAAGFKIRGTAGNLMTLDSTTATNATISIASGIVVSDYLSISDHTATGGATFYAGSHSTDAGGANSGWIFTAPAVAYIEQVILVDALVAAAVFVKAFNEVATLVDSFERTIGKVFIEAAVLVDTMNSSISRAFSEAVVLVDTISNRAGKVFAETVELVDSIAKQLSFALSNSVTIVDNIAKQLSFALFNSVTLVDTMEKVFGKIFTETVALSASIVLYLNGIRAGIWKRVGRIASSWDKTSRISTAWDKVSRIISTWTKIDRP